MPTVEELQAAFHVYFDEIERCRKAETYWALLHVLVSLPDICGALESDDGQSTRSRHVAWCQQYCPCSTDVLEAKDYRVIRNLVLHQGRTLKEGRQLGMRSNPLPSTN